ncbi:hypothetical protein D3C80_1948320 [compost metagenome]
MKAQAVREWAERGYRYPPVLVPFPDELRDLTCGAKTRKGEPCKRRDLYHSGRCRLHGGLSTGPKRLKNRPTGNEPHEGLIKVKVHQG